MAPHEPSGAPANDTLLILCAGLGREVRAIAARHGWQVDLISINAAFHLRPSRIETAVEAKLQETAGRYRRTVVVYGHCGAFGLDAIVARYGAVRTVGPHCYEMYGSERFAELVREDPGTYILTDFLIRAWDHLVVQGLKIDRHPRLRLLLFRHYHRLVYFPQERDPKLLDKAREIAAWLALPLQVEEPGYGHLEARLAAIMEGREQPQASMTMGGYDVVAYPTAESPRGAA
jgi:hypothetical protein